MSSQFLTAAEVAALLRLKVVTVTDMCRSGVLPAHKIGKSWRISPADLDAYLASTHNQQAAS